MAEISFIKLLGSAIIALIVVLVTGPILIPQLHRLKFGQAIREEGPESHQKKSGTPTMGGLMIITAITVATIVMAQWNMAISLALFVMLGHMALGFSDDYIKVVHKHNLGLTAKQKLAGQLFIALVTTYLGIHYTHMTTSIWIPGTTASYDLGGLYYLLVIVLIVGTTNAVNLTDGLDGLASGAMMIAACAYMVICLLAAQANLAIFAAACTGACFGFLKFNANPAKIFMGDTGSLALGGALAALAILTKTELLLIVLGGLFVLEALSVIIQVISFKTTGKRIFKMSPIHHHFELMGWSEKRVVYSFYAFEFFCGILAIIIYQQAI